MCELNNRVYEASLKSSPKKEIQKLRSYDKVSRNLQECCADLVHIETYNDCIVCGFTRVPDNVPNAYVDSDVRVNFIRPQSVAQRGANDFLLAVPSNEKLLMSNDEFQIFFRTQFDVLVFPYETIAKLEEN